MWDLHVSSSEYKYNESLEETMKHSMLGTIYTRRPSVMGLSRHTVETPLEFLLRLCEVG